MMSSSKVGSSNLLVALSKTVRGSTSWGGLPQFHFLFSVVKDIPGGGDPKESIFYIEPFLGFFWTDNSI